MEALTNNTRVLYTINKKYYNLLNKMNTKAFKTGKSLTDYLAIAGFKWVEAEPEATKKYYVNKLGNQVRVDESTGLIAFLDKYGRVIRESSIVSNEQINKFAKGEEV